MDKYREMERRKKESGRPQENKRREGDNSRRAIGIALLWIIVFSLFLVYAGGYAYVYFTRERVTETKIVMGSVESPIITDGVIIRDEVVYRSSAEGVAVYGVPEQTRVKKGDILCSIEDEEKVTLLEEQLQNVNTSIMDLQTGREDLSVFTEDVRKANESVKNIINNAAFGITPYNIAAAYAMSEKIENTMEFRNKMLLNESKGNLKSYTTRKNFLSEQLENARLNISANETGLFSSYVDYQEEYYNFENMDALSKERTLIKTEPVNLSYGKNIEPDSPVFRIVKSNEWYIAAYIPTELVNDWTENSLQTIYVETGATDVFSPLEVRVFKIEKASVEDNERFVLFKCTKYLTDYMYIRGIRFKVKQGIKEGYKIPSSSIVEKTLLIIPRECVFESAKKQKMVIKSVEGRDKAMEVPIVIFEDNKEKDYVSVIQDYNNLRLGDVLMVSGKPLENRVLSEIDNVKGVYVTNSGSAVFKEIVIDDEFLSNSEYLVLNPRANTKIKVHDKIVSDIKNIKENQMVY